MVGLEPTPLSGLASKASAAANYATSAYMHLSNQLLVWCWVVESNYDLRLMKPIVFHLA